VADPDLVVLDEPTDGVDPVGRRDIRDVLLRIRDAGKTVFINSHLLSELEAICGRVAILVKGRVAMQGTLDELTVEKQWYEIEAEADGVDPAARRRAMLAAVRGTFAEVMSPSSSSPSSLSAAAPLSPPLPLPKLKGTLVDGTSAEVHGLTLRVGAADAASVQPVLDALRGAGVVIRRVQPVRQSLEDLFMQAVTDPVTGLAATPGAGPLQPQGGRP
jgi:ABC-2 type transport system ATP-binding protein